MRCISEPLAVLSALLLAFAAAWISPAAAQETVVPETSTRTSYAQVMRVEPVFQTLRATRMEQQCDGKPIASEDPPRGLSRWVGAVKDALHPSADKPDQAGEAAAPMPADCRMVPVRREFRRPIAYDVDYVFKGMKYRSRLPYDPGNRLRILVSVKPYVPSLEQH